MTKQSFLEYCLDTFGTSPDYPFDEGFNPMPLKSDLVKQHIYSDDWRSV